MVRCAVGLDAEAAGVAGEGGGGTFHKGDGSGWIGRCPDAVAIFACAGGEADSLFVTGSEGADAGGTTVICGLA